MTREEFKKQEQNLMVKQNALKLFDKLKNFIESKFADGSSVFSLRITKYSPSEDAYITLLEDEFFAVIDFLLKRRRKKLDELGIELDEEEE